MIKLLLVVVLLLALIDGKYHKLKGSIRFPKSQIVQKGKKAPNREGGFHASKLCSSHFCYDEIRDETCDSTTTTCQEESNVFERGPRKLLNTACSDREGCACLEAVDGTSHCLYDEECSTRSADRCNSNTDCDEGEICASACCGYNQCLTLCCDGPSSTTTDEPTTLDPTTADPTTAEPTTAEPTTKEPTTAEPTTTEPTTAEPTTAEPTTREPTTAEPTTAEPTTREPTTAEPTTAEPTTAQPTTAEPTTAEPTTAEPTTLEPTTLEPTLAPSMPQPTGTTGWPTYGGVEVETPWPTPRPVEQETTAEPEAAIVIPREDSNKNEQPEPQQGGEDDKPEIAPPEKIEQSPPEQDEDKEQSPPAVEQEPKQDNLESDLIARLSKHPIDPQPIEDSPQTADEDGVEPPPAVEAEPKFLISKNTKKKWRKKWNRIIGPNTNEYPEEIVASSERVEPDDSGDNDDDNDDDDNDDTDDDDNSHKKKHKKSKILPIIYIVSFLSVSILVIVAFIMKYYFDTNFYKHQLLSLGEKNENVPLMSDVNDYQTIH